ncbi:MAG: tRNA-(ms[2]io[6]A)-hydroxylase [Cyanobacteria bacterium P01_F01_bin.4]
MPVQLPIQLPVQLLYESSDQWLQVALDDFDSFLIDHAANEKKASSSALTLAAHYPDKPEVVAAMIELAIEELKHYREVFRLMCDRNLTIPADQKDAYIKQLRKVLRVGTETYFLDRLLVASIVESRGLERFSKVAEALPLGPIKNFYQSLTRAEARHADLFLNFATQYYSASQVTERLAEILPIEADILRSLPVRPALH